MARLRRSTALNLELHHFYRLDRNVTADLTGLGEGKRILQATARDDENHRGTSPTWPIYVDRTPPPAPTNYDYGAFQAGQTEPLTVMWDEDEDPDLSDGSPGSGSAETQVRFRINRGSFTAWAPADGTSIEVPGAEVGDSVTIEGRTTDQVGNASSTSSATLTIAARSEDPGLAELAAQTYVTDYGGTLTAARAWMTVQEKAEGFTEDVQVALGGLGVGYGGVWYDNDTHEIVVDLTPGTDRSPVDAVASSRGISSALRIDRMPYTQTELNQGQVDIEADLDDLVNARLVEINRDPTTNSVHVAVGQSATPAQHAEVTAAAAASSVLVTVENSVFDDFTIEPQAKACRFARPRPDQDPTSVCGAPLRGGIRIYGEGKVDGHTAGGQCTAGFNVHGHSGSHARSLLTAGHCLAEFDDESDWSAWTPEGFLRGIGHRRPGFFSGHGEKYDAGLISVDSDSTWVNSQAPRPWIFVTKTNGLARNERYPIRRVAGNPVGSSVCMMGATNGSRCGTISKVSVGPGRYGELDRCGSGEGDSGGPMFRFTGARGLLKGERRATVLGVLVDCKTYFQSASIAEGILDVDIDTTQ